jgi:hypothetical protein
MEGLLTILIQTIYVLYVLFFFFLPITFGYILIKNWVKFVRKKFLSEQKYVLLELRVPKEVSKNPAAMELFITALYQGGGEGNWYDKYIKGGMRAWFSLELVSIEGNVKFMIWTRSNFKKVIESQLYSQYPDIEIIEVDDYAKNITLDGKINLWACHFKKTKDSFYPIKTYIDYGLDKDPKEEYKVDPITPVIEYLGSLGKGEQAWIQIIIRVHKKEFKKPDAWFEKVDWKYFAKEEIKEKMKRNKGEGEAADRLTKGEKGAIEAIERSISKLAFDTGIRAIYVAEKSVFNKPSIAGLTGSFRQYNSDNLNSFAPKNTTAFDYPWQDFKNYRLNNKKKEMLKNYAKRAFFRPIYTGEHFIMNTEELATIYHFPGGVSKTPTFSRIVSRKADAPANLPI